MTTNVFHSSAAARRHRDSSTGRPGKGRQARWPRRIIPVLLTLIPSLLFAQGSQMSPLEWDVDRPGQDYSSFEQPVDDPAYCSTRCAQDPACRAWTYVRPNTVQGPNPRCWLKKAIPNPAANSCCVSGTKLSGAQRQSRMNPMEWDSNRQGGDYNSFTLPANNPALCQERCQQDARCLAWTYVKPDAKGSPPRCWLNDKPVPARRDVCCVSGTKG